MKRFNDQQTDAWEQLIRAMTRGGGYTVASGQPALKLDANENAYGLPSSFYRQWVDKLSTLALNRYPKSDWVALLRKKVAEYAGVADEFVVLGNGSDELIQALFTMLHRIGARVIIPEPTFGFYESAAAAEGIAPFFVPLGPDFVPDWSEWHALLQEESRAWQAIFLCRPNNPTGTVWPREQIEKMLKLPRTLLIVDEAYWEFSDDELSEWLTYENLLLLRTFSKALGLAGMRIGYGLANPNTARAWQAMMQPYNLDVAALWAAILRLDDAAAVARDAAKIKQSRARVAGRLNELGLRPLPSGGNFILFEVPDKIGISAEQLHSLLLHEQVGIRFFAWERQLQNYLRVTIGTEQDNDRFLSTLENILSVRTCQGGSNRA